MEFLQKTVEFLRGVPEWVCLYLIPALVVAAAVAFVFAPKRRWYFCPAAVLVAVGFLLAYAKDSALAFIYLGLAIALVALLSLLFFIPHPAKKEGVSKSRLDAMYEKFHVELSEKPYAPQESTPPKVCHFDTGVATAAESGVSLAYADSLLAKLFEKNLSAGDRLEAEELSRRLALYRDKPLTDAERATLNDCLASILKLTAKYQL